MSADHDLETRLRSLGELSPPTRPLLDCETMHVGASRMQRRQQLMVAIPSILLVVVVLASAVALRNSQPTQVSVAGPNQLATQGTAAPAGLTDRDRALIDVVEATIRLRHELLLEELEAASYASTNKAVGNLTPQRTRTDAALQTFQEKVTSVDPGRESQAMEDALKQADNRIRSVPTIRKSVDAIQTDASRLVMDYRVTSADLVTIERALLHSTDSPRLFRGVFSATNLGAVTDHEAATASLITIAVEIGYYPAVLPTGNQPAAAKNNPLGEGCGEDAAKAGDQCPLHRDAQVANTNFAQADNAFDDMASAEQKQIKRFADAGLKYDELKRHAFEDGQGYNDLRGTVNGTTAIDPAEFRQAARDRIDKLFDAEIKVIDAIRADG